MLVAISCISGKFNELWEPWPTFRNDRLGTRSANATKELVGRDQHEMVSDNPALGQCSVTALVVQQRFGGRLLKTQIGEAWHFYNEIDGEVCDFTAEQFETTVPYESQPATQDEALADTSLSQLDRLAEVFDAKWKTIERSYYAVPGVQAVLSLFNI